MYDESVKEYLRQKIAYVQKHCDVVVSRLRAQPVDTTTVAVAHTAAIAFWKGRGCGLRSPVSSKVIKDKKK